MQRRQLLKLLLPLLALPVGVVVARKLLMQTSCSASDVATLLKRLQPFSDSELGKKFHGTINAESVKRFETFCEEDFAQSYRKLVTNDFAQGKTVMVDGWILSETEALTHELVYQSVAH